MDQYYSVRASPNNDAWVKALRQVKKVRWGSQCGIMPRAETARSRKPMLRGAADPRGRQRIVRGEGIAVHDFAVERIRTAGSNRCPANTGASASQRPGLARTEAG